MARAVTEKVRPNMAGVRSRYVATDPGNVQPRMKGCHISILVGSHGNYRLKINTWLGGEVSGSISLPLADANEAMRYITDFTHSREPDYVITLSTVIDLIEELP